MATASSLRRPKPLLFLSLLLLLFLLVAIVAISTTTNSRRHPITSSHAILRSACSSARYPSLCFSSISAHPSLLSTISSPKSVILASFNLTISAIHKSFLSIQNISSSSSSSSSAFSSTFSSREVTALHDCLELLSDTLDELLHAEADLRAYDNTKTANKTLSTHAAELKVLVAAAITNQDSCLDGFSHAGTDRGLRERIRGGVAHVRRMCSNALAMIKNLIDSDGNGKVPMDLWTAETVKEMKGEVKAEVVVAADGSGDYKTVGEAVAAAPSKSERRYVIRIRAGRYEENVEVTKKKTNIMFVGDGRDKTFITGSRNVVDGSTTFKSATLAVVGAGFLARGLTIENTAGPSKHQAVALRVNADLSAFYDCNILGYQDTLYVHSLRQFFTNCTIQGTIDFIFGNAAVVFQNCHILARRPNPKQKNMVTAQSREDPNEPTGIVIQNCRIAAAPDLEPVQQSFKTYLGRPWKQYSRTVVIESEITDVIDPAGWHEWHNEFGLDTLYYAEYRNSGLGAGTTTRVNWKGFRVIGDAREAMQFSVGNFIEGSGWLQATGFPYSLGLQLGT